MLALPARPQRPPEAPSIFIKVQNRGCWWQVPEGVQPTLPREGKTEGRPPPPRRQDRLVAYPSGEDRRPRESQKETEMENDGEGQIAGVGTWLEPRPPPGCGEGGQAHSGKKPGCFLSQPIRGGVSRGPSPWGPRWEGPSGREACLCVVRAPGAEALEECPVLKSPGALGACQGAEAAGVGVLASGDTRLVGGFWQHLWSGTVFCHQRAGILAQPGKNGQCRGLGSLGGRRGEVRGPDRLGRVWAEKVGMRLGGRRARVRRAGARACAQKRGARPSSRNRTSDLRMSTAVCPVYSPPLYQLSYRRVHAGAAGAPGFVRIPETGSLEGLRPRGPACLPSPLGWKRPRLAPPHPGQTGSDLASRAQHTP